VGQVQQHNVLCEVSGEDLSRYLNKIELVYFLKTSVLSVSYYESDDTTTDISQSLPHIMAGRRLA